MGVAPPTEGEHLVNQNETANRNRCESCGAQLERIDWEESLRLAESEEEDSGRVLVRVTSYRRKLLDRDNLFAKYFIDSCRYSGLIREDTEEEVAIIVRQEKVETKEEERTEIELVYPTANSMNRHNPRPLFA